MSAHRINVRYKQSRLGPAWALLQPLAMMLVFTLMFSLFGRAPSGDVPYPLFAYAALVVWTAFAGGLSSATGSLTGHAALLTKVYFPREILPFTYVLAALVDLVIASLALGALMYWYGVPVTPHVAWSVAAVLLMALLLIGAALALSALHVRYRDVGLAMPVILQVWLFASPVLYPLSLVKSSAPDWVYAVYVLNPMAGIIDTFRRGVVLHQPPDWAALGVSAAVVAIVVPAAYVYFALVERTMADIV